MKCLTATLFSLTEAEWNESFIQSSAAELRGFVTAQQCPSCTGPTAPVWMASLRDPGPAGNQALLQGFGRPQSLSAGMVTLSSCCVFTLYLGVQLQSRIYFVIRVWGVQSTWLAAEQPCWVCGGLGPEWARLGRRRRANSSQVSTAREASIIAAQTTLTALPGDRERRLRILLLFSWWFKCPPESHSFCCTRSGIVDDSTFFKGSLTPI